MKTVRLADLATVVRSKNAGPYELTLDVIFRREDDYRRAKAGDLFSPELIADLYGIRVDQVLKVVYFDPAWAVKATLVRPWVSGSPGDADVYGAQQHAPLLSIEVLVPE